MQPSVDEKKDSPSADGYVNGEMAPTQPMPPMPVNGGMPPQQVYVNTAMGYPGMAALENQFHSMGMSDMHSAGPPESSEGDGENYEGERPVKLFVGQVRQATYCTFFSDWGESCDVYGVYHCVSFGCTHTHTQHRSLLETLY